jgi:hypothetical protein
MSAKPVNDRAQQALVLAHQIRRSAVWADQPYLKTPVCRNKLEAFAQWVAGNVSLWLKSRDGWQFTAVSEVITSWDVDLTLEVILKINQCGLASGVFRLEASYDQMFKQFYILIWPANARASDTEWDKQGEATVLSNGQCFFANNTRSYF